MNVSVDSRTAPGAASAWPPIHKPTDAQTITTLISERAELVAENRRLRAERDRLAEMLNPPA